MKIKNEELDVDFIGGEDRLTPEEEKALSEFFKQRKLASIKKMTKKLVGATKPKTVSA